MGNSDYSAKAIRAKFKQRGVFYTDSRLADIMMDLLGEVTEVYDPACGDGQLLAAFPDQMPKFGQEIDQAQLDNARARLHNFTGVCGDTLASPAFMDRRFNGIVANPPFSIRWEPHSDPRFDCAPCLAPQSKADWAFLLHILYLLAPAGRAVVLNFPGILYRGQREGRIREWFTRQNVIEKVIHIEGGYFEDTKIATALLVLSKHKIDNSVEFIDHEHDLKRVVTLDEIQDNGFNLAVSAYVQPQAEPQAPVDPIALELLARSGALKRIRRELEFSWTVCQIENIPIQPFIDSIRSLVDEFEVQLSTQANNQNE